ncbi:MAG: 3-phosphoshikimate 1-carboxyvinyltransferase, partial [Proteobacteria bacterium]|nr:3-phosphoshikimate 1-carboxyvinyltransferase [Pseudomonadota bacterium]
EGGDLTGIDYTSKQASAQVKSAIILAGLQATGAVSVTEPRLSRDHTERMLSAMGCEINTEKLADGSFKITLPDVSNKNKLKGQQIKIPGDFSAAAFFMVAGSVFFNSEIILRNVGFNETRIGLFHILKRMGANIEIFNQHLMCGEEVVDLKINTANLKAVDVNEEDVVLAIDEIPILTVAASFAEGVTRIRGAKELRVKESDRLKMSAAILSSFGIKTVEYEDGIDVYGNPELLKKEVPLQDAASWKTSGDHRIAMCGAILELQLTGAFTFADKAAVETSFPEFDQILQGLINN